MSTSNYPAVLVIAHDPTCAIYATGVCDCRPTRRVLVGDSEWREITNKPEKYDV